MQRTGDKGEETQRGEAALKRNQRLERGGKYLALDGMYFSLQKLLGATENRETGLSVDKSYGRTLPKQLGEETLRSFTKCIRAWILVERDDVCDGDTWEMIVRSGFNK